MSNKVGGTPLMAAAAAPEAIAGVTKILEGPGGQDLIREVGKATGQTINTAAEAAKYIVEDPGKYVDKASSGVAQALENVPGWGRLFSGARKRIAKRKQDEKAQAAFVEQKMEERQQEAKLRAQEAAEEARREKEKADAQAKREREQAAAQAQRQKIEENRKAVEKEWEVAGEFALREKKTKEQAHRMLYPHRYSTPAPVQQQIPQMQTGQTPQAAPIQQQSPAQYSGQGETSLQDKLKVAQIVVLCVFLVLLVAWYMRGSVDALEGRDQILKWMMLGSAAAFAGLFVYAALEKSK